MLTALSVPSSIASTCDEKEVSYTLTMTDSWGDGWNSDPASVRILMGGVEMLKYDLADQGRWKTLDFTFEVPDSTTTDSFTTPEAAAELPPLTVPHRHHYLAFGSRPPPTAQCHPGAGAELDSEKPRPLPSANYTYELCSDLVDI